MLASDREFKPLCNVGTVITDAHALLLSAGHTQRVLSQPILYFIPDGCTPECFFYDIVKLCLVSGT